MAGNWDGFCAMCASSDRCGTLHIARDGAGELQRVQVCTPCFALIAETLTAVVERPGGVASDLHVPERAAVAVPGGCDICHGLAGETAFDVRLEAAVTPASPAPLTRLYTTSRSHRVCEGCLSWFRDLLGQESATRWTNRRAAHDPRGSAPADLRYRAVCHGLSDAERELVREAAAHLGHSFENDPREIDAPEERVYFVAAGSRRQAFVFTNSLPITERVRVVVVASPEHVQDAADALRYGAADLLAAPLSRQQITGAFDRLADPLAVKSRDEATGLPVYWLRPRFGLPAHLVEVRPPHGADGLDVFLVLRRFLRGYDRIGMATDGSLPVIIYCSDEHIDGIVRRMELLLGPGYDVTVRGRAPADEPLEPGGGSQPAWSSVLGRMYFGRAGSRVPR